MRSSHEIQENIDDLEKLIIKRQAQIATAKERIGKFRYLKSRAIEAEALKVGIDVNIVTVTGEWPDYLVETDEGFRWWSRDRDQKPGTERITRSFYEQIKECARARAEG